MLSLVIPVYRNEANLDRLLVEVVKLSARTPGGLEVVFVVDGSPDRCSEILRNRLPSMPLSSQLVLLSRNFGSFSAVTAGLEAGRGDYFAVLTADLQEPPELALRFLEAMRSGEADIVFGCRMGRSDPWLTEITSGAFWFIYRKFVVPEMPRGGVDVFGCTRTVRDRLLQLREVNTNLIALLFWLGFRRQYIQYKRVARLEGRSAWTFRKKVHYCLDSIFNFTDLPIQLLFGIGMLGTATALVLGFVVLIVKLQGKIHVPGYTPIILSIVFFSGLTSLGLGIVAQYLWLTLQNARGRPKYVVSSVEENRYSPAPKVPFV